MAFACVTFVASPKSVDLAEQISQQFDGFPHGEGFLVGQLNRVALPVAENITAGNGWFTKTDRKNVFGISRVSLHENFPVLAL